MPSRSAWSRVYPNPFTESTWISFKMHEPAPVFLAVYDQLGHEVDVLLNNEKLQPGKYTFQFNSSGINLSAGVYHFMLISNDLVMRQKIVLSK